MFFSDFWLGGHRARLEFLQTPFPNHMPQTLWDAVVVDLLRTPTWIVMVLLGVGLYSFGGWRSSAALRVKPTAESDLPSAPANPAKLPVSPRNELAAALASSRSAFLGIGLFSGMSNILMLTGAFFMLQIYDRVLPSHSVPTLVALAILVAGLYMAQGILDMIRGRILSRIGISLDEALSGRVYDTIVRLPLKSASRVSRIGDWAKINPWSPEPKSKRF